MFSLYSLFIAKVVTSKTRGTIVIQDEPDFQISGDFHMGENFPLV